jgi:hypothetical protein
MVYCINVRPMYNKVSQFLLLVNEIMIYFAATLTFSFTDATYIAIKKYSIGPYWISIIVIALVIDFTALVGGTLYSSGKLANNYLQRRQRFKVQQELIR